MKKLALLWFSVITLSLIFMVSSNAKIDPKTAAGVWLLNEGEDEQIAEDISGNENHGTLVGGPEWVDGKFGEALSFNGQTARVAIPDADSLDLQGAWTITAWIFVNKTEDSYGHILGKRTGTANYAFRISQAGTGWESYFWRDGAWQGIWGQGNVKREEWLYMTAVYDGESMITIYENGVQVGVGGVGKPPPAGESEVHIGGWQGNASELLDGILDEVVLFNVALELEDIEDLMNNGVEAAFGITPVQPLGKLASTWGSIRAK
ncbi:LamG-like jellyroll fold domain-containing protein [Candidatus Poribacteria bacterium]